MQVYRGFAFLPPPKPFYLFAGRMAQWLRALVVLAEVRGGDEGGGARL